MPELVQFDDCISYLNTPHLLSLYIHTSLLVEHSYDISPVPIKEHLSTMLDSLSFFGIAEWRDECMMNLPRGLISLTIEYPSKKAAQESFFKDDKSQNLQEMKDKPKNVSDASVPFWPPLLTQISLPCTSSLSKDRVPHLLRYLHQFFVGSGEPHW